MLLALAVMVALPPIRDEAAVSTTVRTLSTASGVTIWLAGAWLAARALDLLLRRIATRGRKAGAYPRLLSDLVAASLFFLAAIGIFAFVFHQSATGLIATSSVLIAVMGFALRNIVSDIFSGIALNFDRPYTIGDWIEVPPSMVGRVLEITWRTTRMVTRDGVAVIVPNGLIATGRLTNYSAPLPTFRIVLRVALDPEIAIARAKQVLLSGAVAMMRDYPDLRPDVLVQDHSDAGILYLVRFWVPDYEHENVCRDQVAASVFRALRAAGMRPAAPKRAIVTMPEPEPATTEASLLDDCDLFGVLTAEERRSLAARLTTVPFKHDAVVMREGDAASSLYLVREGVLEARIRRPDGQDAAVNRLGAGDVVGEMSLFTGEPRSASVIAITNAALCELRKDDLAPLLAQRPALVEAFADLIATRQRLAAAHLSDLDAAGLRPHEGSAGILRRLRQFFGL